MRSSWILAAAVLLAGCVRVAFVAPVGEPVAAADTKDLVGEWTGEKGIIWRVEPDPNSDHLIAKWSEDGKEQSRTITFTSIGEKVHLAWAEEKDLGAYVPLRISGAEDALALLYPDDEAVKKLVEDGKLTGTYDEAKKAWVITKGDLRAALASKEFWMLDLSLPFVRVKGTKPPEPAPAATAPAAPATR